MGVALEPAVPSPALTITGGESDHRRTSWDLNSDVSGCGTAAMPPIDPDAEERTADTYLDWRDRRVSIARSDASFTPFYEEKICCKVLEHMKIM